jgi:gliding motility-associated lipoprotein GldH
MFNRLRIGVFIAITSLVFACDNPDAIVEVNKEITNRNWTYIDKVRIPVKIEDVTASYALYLNLRHTTNYKYSNIFVLIHEIGPGMKRKTQRKEFKLAYPDGEWLGSGSGNLYSYQLPLSEKIQFSKKGTYIFEIEQNMRDNPLREISDVGLRLERIN